jgi:hypothetical protein
MKKALLVVIATISSLHAASYTLIEGTPHYNFKTGHPLIDAVTRRDEAAVAALLAQKHIPNEGYEDHNHTSKSKNSCGPVTPLLQAARIADERTVPLMKLLLAGGAHINNAFTHGKVRSHSSRIIILENTFSLSPLLAAILSANESAVCFILDHPDFVFPTDLKTSFKKGFAIYYNDSDPFDIQQKIYTLLTRALTWNAQRKSALSVADRFNLCAINDEPISLQ